MEDVEFDITTWSSKRFPKIGKILFIPDEPQAPGAPGNLTFNDDGTPEAVNAIFTSDWVTI